MTMANDNNTIDSNASVAMEAAKQALADAARRYAEAMQDATGTNPKVS